MRAFHWVILGAIGLLSATACSASSSTQTSLGESQPTTLQSLPDGNYLLTSRELIDAGVPDNYKRIHLQKQGDRAMGIYLTYLDDNPCFSGEINDRSLINVSLAQPIAMGEAWRYSTGETIDLTGYQLTSEPANSEAIESCISQF